MPLKQVNKWLWVGGMPTPGDLAGLRAQGVRLDVNTTPLPDSGLPTGMQQVTLGWLDDAQPKPVKDFKKAIKAIKAVARGGKGNKGVLCHCQGGVNRGPMLATAVLAAVKGTTARKAWQKVVAASPGATAWTVPAYKQSIKKAVRVLGKKAKKKQKKAAAATPPSPRPGPSASS